MMSDDGERLAVLETKMEALEKRISALEGNQKWGVMAVLGVVIAAVVNMVMVKQ